MSKGIISYIVLFTILVLLQVMVLNNISVMGYGIPFRFISILYWCYLLLYRLIG